MLERSIHKPLARDLYLFKITFLPLGQCKVYFKTSVNLRKSMKCGSNVECLFSYLFVVRNVCTRNFGIRAAHILSIHHFKTKNQRDHLIVSYSVMSMKVEGGRLYRKKGLFEAKGIMLKQCWVGVIACHRINS